MENIKRFGVPTLMALNLIVAHVNFNITCAAWISLVAVIATIQDNKS